MRDLLELLFPKRLHRIGYLWRILTTNFAIAMIFATSSPLEHGIPALLLLTVWFYQLFFILLPRARDTGMSGWWILLSLVPIIYVFLTIILVFRAPEYHFSHAAYESSAKT